MENAVQMRGTQSTEADCFPLGYSRCFLASCPVDLLFRPHPSIFFLFSIRHPVHTMVHKQLLWSLTIFMLVNIFFYCPMNCFLKTDCLLANMKDKGRHGSQLQPTAHHHDTASTGLVSLSHIYTHIHARTHPEEKAHGLYM